VPDHAIAEIHGNSHWVRCLSCDALWDRASIQARVTAGEAEPDCAVCGGILKSTTVSFGQPMPREPLEHAERLASAARLCLVIGSSLVVYPAAALPERTLRGGGQLGIVNAMETHLDARAAFVSRQPAAVLLGATAALLRAPA
jgi:NAD-dependent deacetylase